jgi:hypothetical protein
VPLTPFQREIARLLATHRNPESHVAGGAAINRSESSPRYSEDIDIFHDAAESVAVSAEADVQSLRQAGYSAEWRLRQEGFYRAEVAAGEHKVRLDWATDSAFRFFPVQMDEEFGYCLHQADLAINKVLALAGRCEVRDFLDILYLNRTYLSLGALIWAACGKDPGYTPALLLDLANRHVAFHEADLQGERLARPLDLQELKKEWLGTRQQAESLLARLPASELGCLYLDAGSLPANPEPADATFPTLVRHRGSIRGAWPRIS